MSRERSRVGSRGDRGERALSRCAAALTALVVVTSASARADVEGDLGLGARASALGGAVSAIGGDYAAANYNPGALVVPGDRSGLAEVGFSLLLAAPSLWVESLGEEPIDVTPVESTYGLTAGARFDIGAAFGAPGLVLGLAVYTPFGGLVQSVIRPDDAPQWAMLTDRTQHITLYAGLAYRIAEWLSVGVGVRILFDEETFITGRADDVRRVRDPETGEDRIEAGARLGVRSAIYGRTSPTVGLLVAPMPTLRFAFAWRGRLYSDDWGYSRLAGLDSVGEIGFLHRFVHIYHPDELAWSAAYAPIDELEISAELTWAMWSNAPSPTWASLEGRFGDVLIPSAGVRVNVHRGVGVLAGYRYVRRPFDDLGGPTNLLVADTHTASLGLEIDLARLLDDEVPITLTLAGRLAILEDREEVKNGRRFPDDRALFENPGYPGYRYGGLVPSAQLGVEAAW